MQSSQTTPNFTLKHYPRFRARTLVPCAQISFKMGELSEETSKIQAQARGTMQTRTIFSGDAGILARLLHYWFKN